MTCGRAPEGQRASPAGAPAAASIPARLQGGLESLYRVRTDLRIDGFLVDEAARDRALGAAAGDPDARLPGDANRARRPPEQLLVSEAGDEVALGLYLDRAALANLERHDPARGLHDDNFADFCLVVEGVSHFVYVAVCAARDRKVTALELELQAEIDKFAVCVLARPDAGAATTEPLRARLYDRFSLREGLSADERARYVAANAEARRYAGSLDRRYLRARRVPAMLAELRRFYRLPLEHKLSHIAAAA